MAINNVAKYRFKLRVWQFGLLAALFIIWWALTKPGLIPAFVFDNDNQAAFFFGEPIEIFSRIWDWFIVNADIYAHLWTTLIETILAFAVGTVTGGAVGMWLALSPFAAAVADPIHQGTQLDASRDSGADFCRVVRAWHCEQGGSWRDARLFHRLFQCLSGRARSQSQCACIGAHAGSKSQSAAEKCVSAFGDELGVFFAAHVCWHGIRRRRCGRVFGIKPRGGLPYFAGRRRL